MKKKISKTLLIILCSIVAGFLLLLIAYLLPTDGMKNNVEQSTVILNSEGKYKRVIDGLEYTTLDNFTDSLMLSNAIYDGNENIIDKSMSVYRYEIDDINKSSEPIESLNNIFTNKLPQTKTTYSRYWHGYLIILKPILMLLDYQNIRVINGAVQLLLVILISILLYKKKKEKYILPYVLSIIMLSPFTIMMSLQYSTIFYISNISLIALLLLDDRLKTNKSYIYYFLIIGIITSYFDFLTYPLVALGFPLIMYFILRDEKSFKTNIKDIIVNSFMWGLGYLSMWIGKIIVGSLLTSENVFKSALGAFESRTSLEAYEQSINFTKVVKENLKYVVNEPYVLMILIFLVVSVTVFILNKNKINKEKLLKIIPFIIISFMPYF